LTVEKASHNAATLFNAKFGVMITQQWCQGLVDRNKQRARISQRLSISD